MRISTARRISQVFFLTLFLWFCLAATLGDRWFQLRGWPVNWIIQLDPLVGLSIILSTRTLYAGLLWGLATVVLTLILGRFFCGWICPFGSMHQFTGYLANYPKKTAALLKFNHYRPQQSFKYWILIFLLTISARELVVDFIRLPATSGVYFGILVTAMAVIIFYATRVTRVNLKTTAMVFAGLTVAWLLLSRILADGRTPGAALQIGLLDPISLVTRSINLVLLPLADRTALKLSTGPRLYAESGLIGLVFLTAIMLNLLIPRFYCRFICPAGALFGVLARLAPWRIGKTGHECCGSRICERHCEGACTPASEIRPHECILCMNCLDDCRHGLMTYRRVTAADESRGLDLSRRQFIAATVSGAAVIPMLRVGGNLASGWHADRVRPPGALPEKEFLSRCIKCGQCMRICPTNVIHPAGLQAGLEGLWTPVLNFRIGTSGCQYNCIACGHLCPTAAIRPIDLDERLGKKSFAAQGALKIGTAFIDRGRCLAWAMDRPCIVCQENCPVSPKAIKTREVFNTVDTGPGPVVARSEARYVEFQTAVAEMDRFASGDYYCMIPDSAEPRPRRIVGSWERGVQLADGFPYESLPPPGSRVAIQIRLQQPYIDPAHCIGCGVCEHECPVPGKRAVRVTADNESRASDHALLLKL